MTGDIQVPVLQLYRLSDEGVKEINLLSNPGGPMKDLGKIKLSSKARGVEWEL